jgi:hypothetical protein
MTGRFRGNAMDVTAATEVAQAYFLFAAEPRIHPRADAQNTAQLLVCSAIAGITVQPMVRRAANSLDGAISVPGSWSSRYHWPLCRGIPDAGYGHAASYPATFS